MKILNLPNKPSLFAGLFIWLLCSVHSFSQITITTPTLNFTQACASTDFNEFQVTFSFYPVQNLGANNQFLVELSDATGSFDTPSIVATLNNTTSPVKEKFAIPESAYGDNYKVRVRSTTPEFTSPESVAFPAYYAIHNQPFSINSYNSTVTLCQGQSYALKIDNNNTSASPAFYPDLTYVWYRNYQIIAGETSSSLTVTQAGAYYCEVDYGDCVMDSYSNIVNVSVTGDITPVITTNSGNTSICEGTPLTLSSNYQDSSFTYTWYKDNSPISNSNAFTYTATEAGVYYLTIDNGTCEFVSNSLDIQPLSVDVSINDGTASVLIIPGDVFSLTANTDAENPTYSWFKDDVAITGQSEYNISVLEAGTYKVIVTQSSPCYIEAEASIEVYSPLYYEATITANTDYQDCNSTAATLTLTTFNAITEDNTIDILDYIQKYKLQWYLNNTLISGANKDSYILTDASENGSYTLDIVLNADNTAISNELAINLATETIEITNNSALCEDNIVTLSSSTSNTNYSYQWYKDEMLISGATSASYDTNQEGAYHLEMSSGSCTTASNTISLIKGAITITSDNPETAVLIPGQTVTLTISTDATNPTYVWYKDDVEISGATSNTLTINNIGTYKVIVSQNDECITTASRSFTITEPSDVLVEIETTDALTACGNTPVNLQISKLAAVTTSGEIDLLTQDASNYSYQWFINDTPIANATTNSYEVSDFNQNGIYKVTVTVPDFGTYTSNEIEVTLSAIPSFNIAQEGALCDAESTVLLTTDLSSTKDYSLAWYKEGNTSALENTETLAVTEAGNYYLTVSDATCTVTSNTIEVTAFNEEQLTVSHDANINLYEGTTITISAEGATEYTWSHDGNIISTTETATISEAGTYTLVATVGSCSVTKAFSVTLLENNALVIPNLVSLNGDGINDTWAIPSIYLNENTTITIYTSNGSTLVKTNNYANNWPENNLEYSSKDPVYYFTISNGKTIIRKGSITIIK